MRTPYPLIRLILAAAVSAVSIFPAKAQFPTVSFRPLLYGFSAPVDIANAHDGSNRLFIVQQGGLIKVWNGTAVSDFIDLSSVINTEGYERGLLSLAFHPRFNGTTNRYFFVYYTNTNGDIEVSRYQTTAGNSNTGDPATRTVIITIPHRDYTGHNGGKLNFGADGYLYFATGDGGGEYDPGNNAQNGLSLLGKMLRIDIDKTGPAAHPHYAIPAGNPYVGSRTVAAEVWDLGLRNPFRWSFDKLTGDIWIGDVGQASEEEIDYRPADSTGHNNFGWRCYEGSIHTPDVPPCSPDPPADYVPPVFTYVRSASNPAPVAIIGGYVYRGAEYPRLYGYYIATELYSGNIFLLRPNGAGGFDTTTENGPNLEITSFGEGEDGTLYGLSDASNALYKLVDTSNVLPVSLSRFTAVHFSGYNEVKWTTVNEQDTKRFYIEYSTNATRFFSARTVAASGSPQGKAYSFRHNYSTDTTLYYRLAMADAAGKLSYSTVIKVPGGAGNGITVYPTLIRNGILTIGLSEPARKLQMYNANGALVFEKILSDLSGTVRIALPPLGKGLYFVQIAGTNATKKEKVIIE